MKLLIIIYVMLGTLITDVASTFHQQKYHKQASKTKDCSCLNGGTCTSFKLFSGMKHCFCPNGFSGDHCEIDVESQCYTGNGEDYRGTTSMTENQERCLNWNSPMLQRWPYNSRLENAMEFGLGKHNYCRNPDGRSKPWCYVRRGYRTFSASCDIPVCRNQPTCGQRAQKSVSKNFKIVGGQTEPIESQPWIAAIFQSSRQGPSFLCGGSLIDPCWVLTAAHCFDKKTPDASTFTVFLGKSATNATDSTEQKFNVDKIIIHERFSQEKMDYDNDIALLKIRSSSGQCAEESSSVTTICLPTENLVLKDNFQCEVSGYGKESRTAIYFSRILKSAHVNLVSQSVCRDEYYYGRTLNSNMFCAGDALWRADSCQGDSGGPLVCEVNRRMVLYGIVSWGDGCAKEERPGVYTRVTNYLPWIQFHMREVHFKSYYPPK